MKRRTLIALLFAIAACAPTDTGNPPAALDGSKIEGNVAAGLVQPVVTIEGGPGTVEPASGEIYLLVPDAPSMVSRIDVEADGSFGMLTLSPTISGNLRAFARTADGVSAAVDWRAEAGALLVVPRSLDACVRVVDVVEADAAGIATVAFANDCAGAVTPSVSSILGEASLMAPSPVIEPGAEGVIDVRSPLPPLGISLSTLNITVAGASGSLQVSVLALPL